MAWSAKPSSRVRLPEGPRERAGEDMLTPVSSLLGGALIGVSASLLYLLHGRIAGISGILGGALRGPRNDDGSRDGDSRDGDSRDGSSRDGSSRDGSSRCDE